jgi:hypothetical protein
MDRLREVLRPFGKLRLGIYNDLSKLYAAIRQEEYKTAGKKFPVGELLNLGEKRTLANYIFRFATCLTSPLRDNIHMYDYNVSNSLQHTIYDALVQGKSASIVLFCFRRLCDGNLCHVSLKIFFLGLIEQQTLVAFVSYEYGIRDQCLTQRQRNRMTI